MKKEKAFNGKMAAAGRWSCVWSSSPLVLFGEYKKARRLGPAFPVGLVEVVCLLSATADKPDSSREGKKMEQAGEKSECVRTCIVHSGI